ncbi:MAG TPA: hypothetical protein VE546_00625 [Streptomyces sp.]|uniref:hypothetical protein n=1 Tax=Streptomyces sp. TaxID=1931 RepID=UPI002D37C9EE|nr:hypothetical protein [Streptomyces sp.]HZG02072.1 hypothetical protein [Streptomyces sp.]
MRTLLKRPASVAVTALFVAAGFALAATPAAADGPHLSVYTTNEGGMANFNPDDELTNACDHKTDGLRAVAILTYNSTTVEIHDATGDDGVCVLKDLDIAEGTKVTLTACLRDGADGANRYCRSKSGTA